MVNTGLLFFGMRLIFCALCFIATPAATFAEAPGEPGRVLRAASELDYPPFALVREDGSPDGFSVELLQAVTRAVGLGVRFEVGPWHTIKQKLIDGRLDVLPLVSYSKDRDRVLDLTAPYLRMHGTIFVRKGDTRIHRESDLKGKEVLVMKGDTAHDYAVRNHLSDRLILTDSYEEAMQRLSDGRHDALIVQQLAGLQIIKKLGITNVVNVMDVQETSLKPVDKPLSGFEQKFCIAVPEGNRSLQALLNEGLAIVIADGTYDALYEKWFGPVLPRPGVPLARLLRDLLFILVPVILLMTLSGLWYLKREVAEKTAGLRREIEERKRVQARLYEKEQNLRITLNSIGDAVIATDTAGRITHINPEAERLTGWDAATAVHTPMESVFRIVNEYSRETVESPVEKVLREGVTVGLANHTLLIAKNGTETPIADSGAPIRDQAGEVTGVILVFRDQSEERAALKAIEESERRYRQLFNHLVSGFALHEIILDAEGNPCDYRFLEVNPAFENITGLNAREIIGKTVLEILPETEPYWIETYGQVAISGRPLHFEKYNRATGKHYSVTAYRPEPGRFATLFLDITDRNRAAQELKKLSEAVLQASEAIVITTPDGTMTYANPAFSQITGYRLEEIIGQTPRILKSGRQDDAFYKQMWETILSGRRWAGRVVNRRKDGTFYTAECSISPVTDARGQIVNFVWITRDITKDLEAEKRLMHSQRIEAIGTLAGGIAHDFNNLLFPIIGMCEMLLEDIPPADPHHDNVAEIHRAATRAGGLVKQILSFSRQSDTQKIPVRHQQIVKEVLTLSRASIPSRIDIQTDIQNGCGFILADPAQLQQIAMNLITNAYHAVEDCGGSIRVSLRETVLESKAPEGNAPDPGRYALLTVSDTGCGIDPSVKNRIFEPYFTTKAQGKGTGLGLSVVYGIVKDYDGHIEVFSTPGKGTTVEVYLPVMERSADPAAPVEIASCATGTETVLVVDDEGAIVRLETQMLERLGYRVLSRTGSLDALAAFRANPGTVDLVLTDMTMPNMTGIELARELLSIRPEIPIIICTGFSEKISEKKARGLGIKGFLMKPVVKSQLAHMVRTVLDESGGGNPPETPE